MRARPGVDVLASLAAALRAAVTCVRSGLRPAKRRDVRKRVSGPHRRLRKRSCQAAGEGASLAAWLLRTFGFRRKARTSRVSEAPSNGQRELEGIGSVSGSVRRSPVARFRGRCSTSSAPPCDGATSEPSTCSASTGSGVRGSETRSAWWRSSAGAAATSSTSQTVSRSAAPSPTL